MRGVCVRTNGRFVYIKSESYFINCVSTLASLQIAFQNLHFYPLEIRREKSG